MNDPTPDQPPSGRGVVAAWLFCLALAALPLGFTSDVHSGGLFVASDGIALQATYSG